jgi:hypothetical protein
MNIYILLASMFGFGFWGYHLATKRGRDVVIGVVVGALGGLIGIGIYALVTRKPKVAPSAQTELAPLP